MSEQSRELVLPLFIYSSGDPDWVYEASAIRELIKQIQGRLAALSALREAEGHKAQQPGEPQ